MGHGKNVWNGTLWNRKGRLAIVTLGQQPYIRTVSGKPGHTATHAWLKSEERNGAIQNKQKNKFLKFSNLKWTTCEERLPSAYSRG